VKLLKARSAWTSSVPGGVALKDPVGDLFIHHSAGAVPKGGIDATVQAEAALIRATREFHINSRGMSDIAYSYGFMPSGRAYTLRGHRTGGHTFCCNSTSIAFLFFGTSDAVPREALDNALAAMRVERAHQIAIGNLTRDHRLRGHREVGGQFGPTACPGTRLFARLAELEEEEDMGFAEYSEAYADRWNKLVAGEAHPRVERIPTDDPARRDAALGKRQADVDFASLKAAREQA